MAAISVLDISSISLQVEEPGQQDFARLAEPLCRAFEETGFVYVSNHGIADMVVEQAMAASMDFFVLEEVVKTGYSKGPEYQGWVAQGREIFDQDEEGKIAELEIRETWDLKNISPGGRFPDDHCPGLRPALSSLSLEARLLAMRLLRCVSLGLGKEDDFLENIHKGILSEDTDTVEAVANATTLRSIHYPAIPESLAERPGVIRCGEHSDYGTITILFQDSLGGLEAKSVSGSWIQADPIPGSLLINVGDLLENLSGGRFPATRHRVVIPVEEYRRKAARQSIAFFTHPDDAVVCQPLQGPDPRYPAVTARGHLENRFRATYGDRLVTEKQHGGD